MLRYQADMLTKTEWEGLPYNPISQHYKSVFGHKVYKVPVSIAETCPNREGLIDGMKVCNFCDVWGSAAYPEMQKDSLKDQIAKSRLRVSGRTNAKNFLIYFQAYTTTYSRVQELRVAFEEAILSEDVLGFVVGTRPDCISDALFDLLNEYAEKKYVAVEFGVQSFDEKQLVWMNRGHTAKRSIQAVKRIREACPKINLGIHLMFGFPGETLEDIIHSARICNQLPIDNVKLHNLHVLKNTELEQEFVKGNFVPVEFEEYASWVTAFLQNLSPNIAVHRLSALSSRSEELIAPKWTSKKMEIYQKLITYLRDRHAYQGQNLGQNIYQEQNLCVN